MHFELPNAGHLYAQARYESGDPTPEGAPILFLHGWATTGRIWRPVFERWQGKQQLVALDLRGAGYSFKPTGAEAYDLDVFTDDIATVIAALGGTVQLVGHSMGGLIAQKVACTRPESVIRLILVSPVPAGGVPLPEGDVAYLKSLVGTRAGMETVLSSMMASPLAPDILAGFVDDSATVSPTQYTATFDMWRRADFAAELSKITAPTTVICGAAEQPLNPELLQATVASLIPGAQLQTLAGVGHYPHYEGPDALTLALEAAL